MDKFEAAFCEIAKRRGLVTAEQISECLAKRPKGQRIERALLDARHITLEKFADLYEEANLVLSADSGIIAKQASDLEGKESSCLICPACGHRQPVENVLVGLRYPCPKCGETMRFEDTPATVPEPHAAAGRKAAAAVPVSDTPMTLMALPSDIAASRGVELKKAAPARPDTAVAKEPAPAAPQEILQKEQEPKKEKKEADPFIGRVIGKCEVIRKLGSGGVAVVYLARHKFLNKEVALKILKPSVVGKGNAVKRFLQEAVAASRIGHANVAEVFDAGIEGDVHYLTMEYIEGRSVRQIMEEGGRLDIPEAIRIFRLASLGLKAAHDKGLVHRDVKPENVLMTKDGEVKVTDFGLVVDLEDSERLTMAGFLAGTPAYLAPERCNGERGDARSDIYSMGVMLHFMIAGRKPFEGHSDMEVLAKHVKEDPPPLRRDAPGVPREIEHMVLKMLRKRPDRRYQHVGEILAELDRFESYAAQAAGGSGAGKAEDKAATIDEAAEERAGARGFVRSVIQKMVTWLAVFSVIALCAIVAWVAFCRLVYGCGIGVSLEKLRSLIAQGLSHLRPGP